MKVRGLVRQFAGALKASLFGSVLTCAAVAQITWLERHPDPHPDARAYHTMAFHPGTKRTVLFGGVDPANFFAPGMKETWEWNGVGLSWEPKFPANEPEGRLGHAMAYDSSRGVIVLYGGVPDFLHGAFADTWEWNGSTWTRVCKFCSPGPRFLHAMAYDAQRRETVLFGNGAGTWVWDGNVWQGFFGSPQPQDRVGCAMAYDAFRERVVLFGGWDVTYNVPLDDTWEWDGNKWQGPFFPSVRPLPREHHAMVFDATRRKTILFGGTDFWYSFLDTWEWDGGVQQWRQVFSTQPPPGARSGHRLAYDTGTGRTVLFGGVGAIPFGDTWEIAAPTNPGGGPSDIPPRPPTTTCWYIKHQLSNSVVWKLVKELGEQLGREHASQSQNNNDWLTILAFGQPWTQGEPGAWGFWEKDRFMSNSAIQVAAQRFVEGYVVGLGGYSGSHLYLAIGTNNYGIGVTREHGRSWGKMVNELSVHLSSMGLDGQITAAGASDMEVGNLGDSWSGPAETIEWVDGYREFSNNLLFNFGNAQGCPESDSSETPGPCGNKGWTQDHVLYVSWRCGFAMPLPEIYNTNGRDSRRWQQLSLYSCLRYGEPMQIGGPLTQRHACCSCCKEWSECYEVQECECECRSGCSGANTSACEAWDELWRELNIRSGEPCTAQDFRWSADIGWW